MTINRRDARKGGAKIGNGFRATIVALSLAGSVIAWDLVARRDAAKAVTATMVPPTPAPRPTATPWPTLAALPTLAPLPETAYAEGTTESAPMGKGASVNLIDIAPPPSIPAMPALAPLPEMPAPPPPPSSGGGNGGGGGRSRSGGS